MSVPTLLTTFASKYRTDHQHEHGLLLDAHGQVVARHVGDFDQVAFDTADLRRSVGGYLTHSHPRALSVSGADLSLAAQYGLTLQAVGEVDGRHVDYTVQFPTPQPTLAALLPDAFTEAVNEAEKQLAVQPSDDLTWEREARHLAVTRLAQAGGFTYRRTGSVLAETRQAPEVARLDVLLSITNVYQTQVLAPLLDSLTRILTRLADTDGRITPADWEAARRQGQALIQRFFLGDPQGGLAPYTVRRGEVQPRSAYMQVLWDSMLKSAKQAVDYQAYLLLLYLPEDVQRAYGLATESPLGDRPPLHAWPGPDGKTIPDRLWGITGDIQRRLDAYLTVALAQQMPVLAITQGLEATLPDVTYEALRLLRTETATVGHRAAWIAAMNNPFVERYQPVLSPTHRDLDECDDHAAQSYPKDDPSHLPTFHANCLCTVRWIQVEDVDAVVAWLREQIALSIQHDTRAVTDTLSPLTGQRFVDALFKER